LFKLSGYSFLSLTLFPFLTPKGKKGVLLPSGRTPSSCYANKGVASKGKGQDKLIDFKEIRLLFFLKKRKGKIGPLKQKHTNSEIEFVVL